MVEMEHQPERALIQLQIFINSQLKPRRNGASARKGIDTICSRIDFSKNIRNVEMEHQPERALILLADIGGHWPRRVS